ncbi:Odorant receptor 47b [Temnothorax longispinosus]|uniref:Odorant receptor 47b n=1 Tax=Temnothorax longispinosus TaxID=300112 RepID=A0A4S2L006_9HYME|nr:Odorant receptor 47b [Temnothorax longispinosus]
MKTLTEFACVINLLAKLFICKHKSARIQKYIIMKISDVSYLLLDTYKRTLTEMKNFLLVSNDHEKIILQKYIDRYAVFSIFVIICYFLTIITFCCIPVFASKKFPSEGLYPFPIESPLMMFIIYATQVHTVVQCGLCVGIDFTFAVFFLYAAARLEMLCFEIQAAKNERHINSCIKKHQEIIKFVDETKNIVQCCLFMTIIVMAVAAVCGTFPIIYLPFLFINNIYFIQIHLT